MKTLAWALLLVAVLAADFGHIAIFKKSDYPGHEGVGILFLCLIIGFVFCAVFSA